MLSGFVPPQELIDRAANIASFQGRPYAPVADLLKPPTPPPAVTFGAADDLSDAGLDHADAGPAEVVLSGVESPTVGVASPQDDTVLLTLHNGVLAVDLSKKRTRWAAPVAGCHGSPLVLPDGSIAMARAHGIGLFRENELRALASGAATSDNSKLLLHPDGSVCCLDPGTAGSPPMLIKAGSKVGDEQWRQVSYRPGRATAAAWLTAADLVVAGNPDVLVVSEKRQNQPKVINWPIPASPRTPTFQGQ